MPKLTKKQRAENMTRAQRGGEILAEYRARLGDDDDQCTLADALADLMHYSGTRAADPDCPMDFEHALRTARMHYNAEITGAD